MIAYDEQIKNFLLNRETENLEFKEAKNAFNIDSLLDYCCALANEGGGKLILGITNSLPRKVVGSDAFRESRLDEAKLRCVKELGLRVNFIEIYEDGKRVLVIDVPGRPIGKALRYRGRYLMRAGESLVDMTDDMLSSIIGEKILDYSSEICEGANLLDLEPAYIDKLKKRWSKKSGRSEIINLSDEQALEDLGLIFEGSITYAALILLGKNSSLKRLMPQTEVIFEFRNSESEIPFVERIEFRKGFFGLEEDLWDAIDKRNPIRYMQIGFFKSSIRGFNEGVVREAILNAVSHREYRDPGSVFVRQYESRLDVQSPGGFPRGVDPTNILWKQVPRNRLISETLAKCGYVERSGQGADIMYTSSLLEGKHPPDYAFSDSDSVYLRLSSLIENPNFVSFIENIGEEKVKGFTIDDFVILNSILNDVKLPAKLKVRLPNLIKSGVVERVGKKIMLSRGYYEFIDKKGEYTRQRGLDRETNKLLLLRHINQNNKIGSVLSELCQVLPSLSEASVQSLLQELKKEEKVVLLGRTRGARWHINQDLQNVQKSLFTSN